MDSNNKAIQSAKIALATAASLAASAVLAKSLIDQFLPNEFHNYFSSTANSLRSCLSSQHTIVIEQTEGFSTNQVFDAAKTYLATKVSTSMRRIKVSRVEADEKKNTLLSLESGEELIDMFEGVQFKWRLFSRDEERTSCNYNQYDYSPRPAIKVCSYELSFHKKHQDVVLTSYLPYIQERAEEIKVSNRTLKLYTNDNDCWDSIDLHHPATFESLAMDSKLKQAVMDDLARFVKRKEYYKKIGKAWKRGYLLYGPPGTGKSSLVAAMANYLNFDIYDLELTQVRCNSELRRLLVGTANRSIIVVEDIDCSIDIKERESGSEENHMNSNNSRDNNERVTLSGLLNFVDGLWSSCGEERIVVFTTNYKDRLDQALLRPGRMDMHICMGYCTRSGFRVLASNYHDLDDHPLFREIEELIDAVEVTPTEVAETLMKSDDEEVALQGLIGFIQDKKMKVGGEVEGKEDCARDD